MKTYAEKHQQGVLLIEKDLKKGIKECDLGIQIARDGRIWLCMNGQALLRFKPEDVFYKDKERSAERKLLQLKDKGWLGKNKGRVEK